MSETGFDKKYYQKKTGLKILKKYGLLVKKVL